MIPPHRPFFSTARVVGASLLPREQSKTVRGLEEAYATANNCAAAVWLPSARAGIAWALRATIPPETKVVGPAFTCSVVHEAMVRSGGQPCIVDAADNSFAMEPAALRRAATGNFALVLSEPYGHAYDLAALANDTSATPAIRIVDAAMAVPQPALFARLRGNDFAIVSFGTGKNMYAGWGAMGFTQDATLANKVRGIRDTMMASVSFKLATKRSLSISLRTAAQNPLAFSATRKLWYQANALRSRNRVQTGTAPAAPAAPTVGFPAAWTDDHTCGTEWRLPSTRVDRGLALRNLETAALVHAKRVALAARYHRNLSGQTGFTLPPTSPFALSHYTVRVAAEIRTRVKEELYRRGVYTISLWTFSAHLNPQDFLNASRCCAEVINLPLSPWMSEANVDGVCEHLAQSLKPIRA